MEHSLRASSLSVPETSKEPGIRSVGIQSDCGLSRYRWQSTAAARLTKLHGVLRDLHECRECLRQAAQQPQDRSSGFLVLAALTFYRRAGDGEISKGLGAYANALGPGANALHASLMGAAGKLLAHSAHAAGEAMIAINVQGNQIVGVSCHAEHVDADAMLALPEALRHVELIERRMIRPEIGRSEAQVLAEAQALGIQLVRHLPAAPFPSS
jgi:hypothetical protein